MAYEAAREFLARVVAWPDASNPAWFVHIYYPFVGIDKKTGKSKTYFSGFGCRTLNEAIHFIEWLDSQRANRDTGVIETTDVYVCMSAQALARQKINARGRPYFIAQRSDRDAVWYRSSFLDVDVKPGDPTCYDTPEEALAAFDKFCVDTGLPPPTFLIFTGSGGFHVHWVYDDPIRLDRWQPIANALRTACDKLDFKADVKCTTDAVRILRVPDTHNHKHSPPRLVEIGRRTNTWPIELIEGPLEPYKGMAVARPARSQPTAIGMPEGIVLPSNAPRFTELMPNWRESLPSLADLRKCCPLIEQAAATGGVGYHQPLWWETVKLAYKMREGEDAAHAMADEWGKSAAEDTHQLWLRTEEERTPFDRWGFPQCQTIKDAGSTECASCKWMVSGDALTRSPFNFVGMTPDGKDETPPPTVQLEEPIVVDLPIDSFGALPPGYAVDNFVIHKLVPDEKDKTLIHSVPIWSAKTRRYHLQPPPHPALIFETLEGGDTWVPVSIPVPAINAGGATFGQALGDHLLTMTGSQRTMVNENMQSFVQMLRDRRDSILTLEANGWSFVDGEPDAFCYGGVRYNCNGVKPTARHDDVIQKHWMPTGKPEPFRRAVQFVHDQKRLEFDAALAAGFGAPLMEFTSQRGVIFHLKSIESAHGKTSVMRVVQAICADPLALSRFDDTNNSIGKIVSTARNLAVPIDEIQNIKEFMKVAFSLTSGKGKGRLGRSSQHMAIETHATIMLTTSNQSLWNAASDMNTSAAAYRIFEVYVSPRHTERAIDYDEIFQSLFYNYGHPMAVLGAYLGANAKPVRAEVLALQNELKEKWGATDQERFWIALVTCILLGATYANKLGLAQFDLPKLTAYLYREFRRHQKLMSDSPLGFDKPENKRGILERFLNDNTTAVLTTDKLAPERAGPPGPIVERTPPDALRWAKKLDVQRAEDEKRFIVAKRSLLAFLKKHGMGASELAELEALGRKRRATLGAGTSYPKKFGMTNETVIEFDETHQMLQGIFD